MRVLIFGEAYCPDELRRQMLPWHAGGPPAAHDPALRPASMLLVDGARVLAALDLLFKEITHAGAPFAAAGLSRVITDPAERRRGYGKRLIGAAGAEMAARGVDVGIFTADRPLRRFYESGGWTALPGTVLIGGTPEEPFPSNRFDKLTFAAFFTDRARTHARSFSGSRIGLYSGEIDRLW